MGLFVKDSLKLVLPETNSSHLKKGGWKTTFLLGRLIFRGYVKLRGGYTLRHKIETG